MGNLLYATLIIVISICYIPSSYATFYIKGSVEGKKLHWNNVTTSSDILLATEWQTVTSLMPVESWVPSSLSMPYKNNIVLAGIGSNSEPIPVDVIGVEYNTTGINFSMSNSNMGKDCLLDEIYLPVIRIVGDKCVSDTKLSSEFPVEPFVFFRPIFKIDSSDIVLSLKGKPAGYYSGMLPLAFKYYYTKNGILTYRVFSDVLIVGIDYNPAMIDRITLVGTGVMEPSYDLESRRVSAETLYNIVVEGFFTNGLNIFFPKRKYQLTHETDNTVKIPYSVKCISCADVNIADGNGNILVDKTSIGQHGSETTRLEFNLSLKYNADGESLVSGTYSDVFTVILEVNI